MKTRYKFLVVTIFMIVLLSGVWVAQATSTNTQAEYCKILADTLDAPLYTVEGSQCSVSADNGRTWDNYAYEPPPCLFCRIKFAQEVQYLQAEK